MRRQVGTNVEIGRSRSATEPFQDTAAGKICVQRRNVHGNGAQRLKSVEQDHGADLVGAVDDRLGVIDVGAAEDDVRDGDDKGLLVDGGEHFFGRNVDAVGGDHLDAGAALTLGVPEVHHRREVQVGVNDLVAFAAEVEAGGDDGLNHGDVLMAGNRSGGGVHQGANLVADLGRQHPPLFLPGADAALRPCAGVGEHGVEDAAGHGAQGVGDQVGGAIEDGELGAVAEKLVLHGYDFSE